MAAYEQTTADGFPKAIRKHTNIVSLKTIALDLDVKPGAYATTDDAYAALEDFCQQIGMPEPTMEVLSGSGGVHVYWGTELPMPFEAWKPLAKALQAAAVGYGLKCDPQVTVNPVGILRVPNSFNHKTNPPGSVLLMEDSSFAQYRYQDLVGALRAYIGGAQPGAGTKQATPPPPPSHMKVDPNLAGSLSAGAGPAPVSIEDVRIECGVVDDVLTREGNGDAEPLWNSMLYLASFTEDLHEAAHKMSRGDPRYTVAETDRKLNEKIVARQGNPQMGWPKCSSISPLHSACITCRHFAENKTPLHFAHRHQAAPKQGGAPDPLLPPGYWRDIYDHVYTTVFDKKGNPTDVDVLGRPILDAAIDSETGDLVVRTRLGGVERWGNIPVHTALDPTRLAQALAKGTSIFVKQVGYKVMRDFFVSWMSHLQDTKRTIVPATYGWTKDGTGFTYDTTTYFPGRKELIYRGNNLDARFVANGELQPWQDAMQLVYKNPPLETLTASAFAGPLVELVGAASVVLSIFSHLSGVGKTTAMMIAQAVWGDPREGMAAIGDTDNSVLKKIADLKNLPVYWDELKTQEDMERITALVFRVTQGKGKARLTRDIKQQHAGTFTTMFTVASNYGIADSVYATTDGTEAGGLRIFEIEAQPLPPSKFTDSQSRGLLVGLSQNYGVAGAQYAEFLANNRPTIKQLLDAESATLEKQYKFTSKERFWLMTMTTLAVGAQLANACGLTSYDVPSIRQFLATALGRQRAILATRDHKTMAAPDSALVVLQDLVTELRSKHVIFTDFIANTGQGGRATQVKLVDTDIERLGIIWMQVGRSDGRIRIRAREFEHWLRERRLQPAQFVKQLAPYYMVQIIRGALGAGLPASIGAAAGTAGGRTQVYDLYPTPAMTSGSTPGVT